MEMNETTEAAETLFAEQAFHSGRVNFPAREVAEILMVSAAHISNLIKDREIIVPQENIDRAASRASIMIPRESLVDFLRRRTRYGPRNVHQTKANEAKRNPARLAVGPKTAHRKKDQPVRRSKKATARKGAAK